MELRLFYTPPFSFADADFGQFFVACGSPAGDAVGISGEINQSL
jgi:hypothetical protein